MTVLADLLPVSGRVERLLQSGTRRDTSSGSAVTSGYALVGEVGGDGAPTQGTRRGIAAILLASCRD